MSFNLKLHGNDLVALACPGCMCQQASHPSQVQDYLQTHYGLRSIFKEDTTKGMPAAQRAEIFLDYLFNNEIKMITILRGGEGTADTLPYIHQHYAKIKSLPPKLLVGLSDFTAMLVYFSQYYHWPVIHGASPLQFALERVTKESEEKTMNLLFGIEKETGFYNLQPLNSLAQEDKIIEAELTGGNLSVLNISIKDIWEIDTTDKIIFFEDIGEKAHKIIRTLKYFSRLGLFEKAKAVIFGDFICENIGCSSEEQAANRQAILKTLSSFAAHHQIPVLSTEQFGHGKTNFPLIYSVPYRLELGMQPTLKLAL